MNYLFHILVMINIYVILSLSLNLLAGYTGLISLAHAAFYGIGAYATTLAMMKLGWNFFPALVFGVLFTALTSFVIGKISLRLKGDYFVLATLGFQILIFSVLYNWVQFTRGPYGIPGIPVPSLFGFEFDSIFRYFILTLVLAGISAYLIFLIKNSPFGRVLKAIREDEIAVLSIAKDISTFKTKSFVISSIFPAVSGALFAGYMRYIDPTSFTLSESIFIISAVIIGGAGTFQGPIAGATFMVVLPEILRFLQIPDSVAANLRQIIYGFLLVVLMYFRPRGLFGEYDFK